MTKLSKIVSIVIAFGAVELITFYAYSLIWLKDGQPEYSGDPVLRLLEVNRTEKSGHGQGTPSNQLSYFSP